MIYIIFVVDYSKFLKLNLPRTKYGDFEMKDKMIKRLRTGRGGECKSNHFNEFCELNGIIYEITLPYSPESNGVVERKNISFKEMMN